MDDTRFMDVDENSASTVRAPSPSIRKAIPQVQGPSVALEQLHEYSSRIDESSVLHTSQGSVNTAARGSTRSASTIRGSVLQVAPQSNRSAGSKSLAPIAPSSPKRRADAQGNPLQPESFSGSCIYPRHLG